MHQVSAPKFLRQFYLKQRLLRNKGCKVDSYELQNREILLNYCIYVRFLLRNEVI